MDFQGNGQPLSAAGMANASDVLAVDAAAIWTVLTVETRAFGFLADRRPQILFERHVFHRLTNGQYDDTNPGISNPTPGGYSGDAAEYPRLAAAIGLDRAAALSSVSWGIGQLMGFNFPKAGFPDVETMVAAMVHNEDAQLTAMAKWINGSGLSGALQQQDWATFARGYNGIDFQKNAYDTRLAAAHASCMVALPDLSCRTAQAALLYLGFDPGPIDGMPGKRTRAAALTFQQRNGLPTSGELDAATETRLMTTAFPGQ